MTLTVHAGGTRPKLGLRCGLVQAESTYCSGLGFLDSSAIVNHAAAAAACGVFQAVKGYRFGGVRRQPFRHVAYAENPEPLSVYPPRRLLARTASDSFTTSAEEP